MKAFDWRWREVNPTTLLARYRMTITAGPSHGWRVVELRETHGRPHLRNLVRGTNDPIAFRWRTNESDFGVFASKMEWDDVSQTHQNTLNLIVNNQSYYWPGNGQSGPHIVRVAAEPSDEVRGWGLAQDLPDQPPMEADNRYQTLIVVWAKGSDTPPDPVPPPPTPGIPTALIRADLEQARAAIVQALGRLP